MSWFGNKRKPLRTDPIDLLTGTAVKTEKGYYYIKSGARIPMPTQAVVDSWNFNRIVEVSEAALVKYPVLSTLGFRDGTLLFCIADGRYYLVANRKRHLITSPTTLSDHGLVTGDAVVVSQEELDLHKEAN